MFMSTVPDWLEGARLAPSRFNSQPWRFEPQPDGDVLVSWDRQRSLPASDPTGRDLFLALGAAVESACIRASISQHPMMFLPASDAEESLVGRLSPADLVDDPAAKRLAPYVGERRTARTRHLRFPLPPVVQLALRRETVGWGCRLHMVTDKPSIRRLASAVYHATLDQLDNRETRGDVAAWYRLASGDAVEDGVTTDCLDLEGAMLAVTKWAIGFERSDPVTSWTARRVVALRDWRITRQTSAFCLLTAQSNDRTDMVRAGRLLLRLWLLTAEAGLNVHPLSPLLSSEKQSKRCIDVFGAQGGVPACIYRVGFCPPVPASPRLPASALMRGRWSPRRSPAERSHR